MQYLRYFCLVNYNFYLIFCFAVKKCPLKIYSLASCFLFQMWHIMTISISISFQIWSGCQHILIKGPLARFFGGARIEHLLPDENSWNSLKVSLFKQACKIARCYKKGIFCLCVYVCVRGVCVCALILIQPRQQQKNNLFGQNRTKSV